MKIFWIVKKACRFCFPYIMINILVMSFSTFVGLMISWLSKLIVNELTTSIKLGHITSTFIALAIVYMILYLINMGSGFLAAFGGNSFKLNVNLLFHKMFMYRCYKTPQEKFFDSNYMDVYSFVSGNTNKISSYIAALCRLIFSNIGTIISAFVFFIMYEPLLIIYSLIIALVTIFSTYYISKKEFELDKIQIKEQRYHDYYQSLLIKKENAKELRIFKTEKFLLKKWVKHHENLRKERLNLSLKRLYFEDISDYIKFFAKLAAILILLLGVANKEYDLGTFVLLLGLIDTCNGQISTLVSTVTSGAYKDTKYLCDYYDYVTPITNQEINTIMKQTQVQNENHEKNTFSEIAIKNVRYTYPQSNTKALDNVSLTIHRGEIVSILGYNGSGKTTLSKLINGSLLPNMGTIKINGIEINENNKFDIFKLFSMAPQEYSRYCIAMRDFISLGCVEHFNQADELNAVYQKMNLHSFIDNYPNGDETILGKEYDEEGVDLSGGEWQRLVIASAYMGDKPIMILDEPTASIDPIKEVEMIENFRQNIKGKTAVLISHRIGFARLADRIIIMDGGKIIEAGTHEELLLKNGYYSKIFNEQKNLYSEV